VSSASVPQTGRKSLMTEIWMVGVVREWLAAYGLSPGKQI
jgi:hypothetical protein